MKKESFQPFFKQIYNRFLTAFPPTFPQYNALFSEGVSLDIVDKALYILFYTVNSAYIAVNFVYRCHNRRVISAAENLSYLLV